MRSSVRSRLAPPIGVRRTEDGSSLEAACFLSRGRCPIHRVSPCASRGAFTENDVSGAVYPSSVFRSLLSVIVKRKHIRSVPEYGRRSTGDGCSSVFRSPSSDLRSEPLSRGPRLTARLPGVFEAKLVFSTEGALPSALSVYRGGFRRQRSEVQVLPGPPGSDDGIQSTEDGSLRSPCSVFRPPTGP